MNVFPGEQLHMHPHAGHAHAHNHASTCTHTLMQAHAHAYSCKHMHTHTHTQICINTHTLICTHTHQPAKRQDPGGREVSDTRSCERVHVPMFHSILDILSPASSIYIHKVLCAWVGRLENKAKQFPVRCRLRPREWSTLAYVYAEGNAK